MENKMTETMVSQSNRQETEELIDFLETLEPSEIKEFLVFAQGAKFMKNIVVVGAARMA